MFPKNINSTGRILRGVAAVILLVYGIWQHSWIALLFSAFIFFETFMSWCAIRHFFGGNGSCAITPKPEKKSEKLPPDPK